DLELKSRRRPCLQHQIKRCPAPCVLEVDPRWYGEQVRNVELFLDGRHDELSSDLNGDGLTDLLVANGLTLAIWAQRADRTFAAVNYLQLPAVNAPCPENPDLKLVRTVRGLASGELDGAPGVDLLVATEDTCEQTGTPQTARLFVSKAPIKKTRWCRR
ncbi:MAG TPA: hypothetical protein PKL15_11680, partial [Saprospiraceae bacterium]|nr:hypothetical protein [Saprospiraceae bacterium]